MASRKEPVILIALYSCTGQWLGCLCLLAPPFISLEVFYALAEFAKVSFFCLSRSCGVSKHLMVRCIVIRLAQLSIMIAAARYKREAERLKVQEDLAETERRRTELRGLLAMYSNQ